jgi:hypothetical protein
MALIALAKAWGVLFIAGDCRHFPPAGHNDHNSSPPWQLK